VKIWNCWSCFFDQQRVEVFAVRIPSNAVDKLTDMPHERKAVGEDDTSGNK